METEDLFDRLREMRDSDNGRPYIALDDRGSVLVEAHKRGSILNAG